MDENTITRKLRYDLEDPDRLKISEKMSEAVMEKSQRESELNMLKSAHKSSVSVVESKITTCDAIINECADILNAGFEFRDIECLVLKDYEEGKIRIIRTDTTEEVECRPMTDDDRQVHIDSKMAPDAETLRDLLSLVDINLELEIIEEWSSEEKIVVRDWASAVHLQASDNEDVEIPERPEILDQVAGQISDRNEVSEDEEI